MSTGPLVDRLRSCFKTPSWVPVLLFASGLLLLIGCGESDPVKTLVQDLNRYPEFSLILDDARTEEGFFPDYFLRFKILTASGQRAADQDTVVYQERVSEEYKVSQSVFERYENYLGMVIASKTMDGRQTDVRQSYPPGYQHVGNPQYGSWGSGGFWQFYGPYLMMQQLMGGWRVNRDDYDEYRRTRERGQPYAGPMRDGRPTFGSAGAEVEKSRPEFYKRYQQRMSGGSTGRSSFGDRASGQMGRGTSSWGSGSFSGGK